jgi:hypothetical protein
LNARADNNYTMKERKKRVPKQAILSSVHPIQTHLSSNEQSNGVQSGVEELALPSLFSLGNVASHEMSHPLSNDMTKAYGTSTMNEAYDYQSSLSGTYDFGEEDDDDERVRQGRERNREHARKTRLRKKEHLQELEKKYGSMLVEKQTLNQQLQDRSIAAILLGLSTSTHTPSTCMQIGITEESRNSTALLTTPKPSCSVQGQVEDVVVDGDIMRKDVISAATAQSLKGRKRGFPEVQIPDNIATLKININGTPTAITSKSHVNWKTGMYRDERGRQSQMTTTQLEDLRYVFYDLRSCNISKN